MTDTKKPEPINKQNPTDCQSTTEYEETKISNNGNIVSNVTSDNSENSTVSDNSGNSTVSDNSGNGLTETHMKIIKYVCSKTNLSEREAYNGLMFYNGNYEKVIAVANMYQTARIITRQTTYSVDEAIQKLREHKGNPIKVIEEFIGIKKNKIQKVKSTNQMVYSEIRNFMGEVSKGYEQRKKRDIAIQHIVDNMNKQKELQSASKQNTPN